ncbi:MAG: DUF4105 domain-containing protein [Bacteroidales bacterium]|nr:DUF4105 domain-containing protein [Bacteroidales bacterium]MDD4216292.1 DUF4105 domain-containing protein [Bacteroidales bacterium]MDY0141594.1 DUF4105 domain-containing protein [Bacteroidales bacterium]
MKKIASNILLLILISANTFALSRDAQVSLLTQDAGDELYAYFGHTAIRIKDDSLHIDRVYNYGTFNFNTPNFYLKFIHGDLDYCLSIDDFDYFVYVSSETKRTIHEQVLNLTYEEKVKMANLLETCYTTSARYYRYDFLKNNCATKIRDIIEDATDNRINFDKSGFSGQYFRQLLKPFISKNYWIDLGINLATGMETDKAASPSDYMFLPVYIYDFFEDSEFAQKSYVLLDATPEKETKFNFSYLSPWIIVLLLIAFSFLSKTRKIVLYTISIIFTLLGLLLFFLNVYSLHLAMGSNLNVLWTLPAFVLIICRKRNFHDYLKLAYLIIIILFISLQSILPQNISFTFIPWMLLIIVIILLDIKVINKRIFRKKKV